MSRILLDTNICIYIIKDSPKSVRAKLGEYKSGDVFLSTITQAELYFGVEKSKFKNANLSSLNAFLSFFPVLNFDEKSAIEYAKIRTNLEKSGKIIGAMDMLIASIAISNDITLVTNNTKEFERVPNLRLENWI